MTTPAFVAGYTLLAQTNAGWMLLPKHDLAQTGALLSTGDPIDRAEIEMLRPLIAARAERLGAGVVLDVGANVGNWSLALSRFDGVGFIYAFEPQHVLHNMICGSLALNNIENVWCSNVAVGSVTGVEAMQRFDYSVDTQFGSANLGRVQAEPLAQTTQRFDTVPVTTIDRFMRFAGRPTAPLHFIKLDVEGMELAALEGATETIRAQRPLLYVEHLKSDRPQLERVLTDLGYSLHDTDFNFLCTPNP